MTSWFAPPAVVAHDAPPGAPLPRVKVCHVITRFWAGAGGNTLLSAIGMPTDRYDCWVVGAEGGPLWDDARAAGLQTRELAGFAETIRPLKDLRVLLALVRLMRAERFDVVHTHSTKGGLLGRVAARLTRTPVVIHTFHGFAVHDGLPGWKQRAYGWVERRVRRLAHAYVAVAPRVAAEAVTTRLAPPGSVRVVPSAVSLGHVPTSYDDAGRARLGVPAGAPLIGTVGRLDAQKAPLDFVAMASRVQQVHPDARFVWVGDGPMRSEVEQAATRAGVTMAFTGDVRDAPALAASFDVYVVTSHYEGLGRAVTEALASGRPVVATAVNGVPDLVVHGATGLLAPVRDTEALAGHVSWLLRNREAGAAMGEQGRSIVRQAFQPERMCAGLDALYSELLGLPAAMASDHRVIDLAEQLVS